MYGLGRVYVCWEHLSTGVPCPVENLDFACMFLCLCVRGRELYNTSTCKRLVIPEPRKAVSAKATAEGQEAPRAFPVQRAAENAPDWEEGDAGDEEKAESAERGWLPTTGIKGKKIQSQKNPGNNGRHAEGQRRRAGARSSMA